MTIATSYSRMEDDVTVTYRAKIDSVSQPHSGTFVLRLPDRSNKFVVPSFLIGEETTFEGQILNDNIKCVGQLFGTYLMANVPMMTRSELREVAAWHAWRQRGDFLLAKKILEIGPSKGLVFTQWSSLFSYSIEQNKQLMELLSTFHKQ